MIKWQRRRCRQISHKYVTDKFEMLVTDLTISVINIPQYHFFSLEILIIVCEINKILRINPTYNTLFLLFSRSQLLSIVKIWFRP